MSIRPSLLDSSRTTSWQLIGSVCVEDLLKPLLSRVIVTLCCGMVHNFVREAKVTKVVM
jgi:hypothetical protein